MCKKCGKSTSGLIDGVCPLCRMTVAKETNMQKETETAQARMLGNAKKAVIIMQDGELPELRELAQKLGIKIVSLGLPTDAISKAVRDLKGEPEPKPEPKIEVPKVEQPPPTIPPIEGVPNPKAPG